MPFFYFVGFISGFLSLIPYMGWCWRSPRRCLLASGTSAQKTSIAIAVTVLGLHLISVNVLYPESPGQPSAIESPGGDHVGLLVWAGSGERSVCCSRSHHRSHENYLRPRRIAEAVRDVAGRVSGRQSLVGSRWSTATSHVLCRRAATVDIAMTARGCDN